MDECELVYHSANPLFVSQSDQLQSEEQHSNHFLVNGGVFCLADIPETFVNWVEQVVVFVLIQTSAEE